MNTFKNEIFELNEINFINYLIIKEDREKLAERKLMNTRTHKILAAKDGEKRYLDEIVSWVADELEKKPLIIIPYPSTDKDKDIKKQLPYIIAERMRQKYKGWINGGGYLIRKYSLPKNTRDMAKQYGSLLVRNRGDLKGKNILLLDDVTTSGSSFSAGLKMLAKTKPKKLKALAIAKKVYLKGVPLSGVF